MSTSVAARGTLASSISKRWGWFVALGIALITLGAIAGLDVTAFTVASTTVIGATLLVGGVLQIFHAFMTREWRGFVFRLLLGVLSSVGGILVINEPVRGAVVLTLVLVATVVAGGVVRIVLAWRHRDMRAWGLMLLSGIVSIAVGGLLYRSLPWSGLWVLGALIAVELLVQGGGWLYFGIALRLARDALTGGAAVPAPTK
jgi:uncharacterized membrane protein HdeD (DUF308 family)